MDLISFAFGALVGFAALPIFWVAFAIIATVLWSLVVYERGGWAIAATIAFLALVVSKWTVLLDYATWTNFLIAIPAFGVFGVLWARYKWSRFISKAYDRIIEQRSAFLKKRSLPAETLANLDARLLAKDPDQGDADVNAETATQVADKVAALALVNDYKEYAIKYMGADAYGTPLKTVAQVHASMAPQASNNKGSIIMWITYWPISVIWYIIGDLMKDLGLALYKMVGGNFQKMSDAKFKTL